MLTRRDGLQKYWALLLCALTMSACTTAYKQQIEVEHGRTRDEKFKRATAVVSLTGLLELQAEVKAQAPPSSRAIVEGLKVAVSESRESGTGETRVFVTVSVPGGDGAADILRIASSLIARKVNRPDSG